MAIQPTIELVRTTWTRRAGVVACGCAAVGLAAVVALNDPADQGSVYPACIFRSTTGLWCPGCGLTRGFHQLLNGHVGAALSYNLFVPLVALAAVWGWVSWLRTSWGRTPLRLTSGTGRALAWALPIVAVAYGVLRNIPAQPFNALAP